MDHVQHRGEGLQREIDLLVARLDLDDSTLAEIRTRPLRLQLAILGTVDETVQFFRSRAHKTLQ
ncbi:MAG TPA: hypothetical protein VHD55_00130 [Candidatus Paceibacterota bacterium]|nr:hypothetical protein [Candidatus Paceibacterota bacterium]